MNINLELKVPIVGSQSQTAQTYHPRGAYQLDNTSRGMHLSDITSSSTYDICACGEQGITTC